MPERPDFKNFNEQNAEFPPQQHHRADAEKEHQKRKRIPGCALTPARQEQLSDDVIRLYGNTRTPEQWASKEHIIDEVVLDFFIDGGGEEYRGIFRMDDGYLFYDGKAVRKYQKLSELCAAELTDANILRLVRESLWDIVSPVLISAETDLLRRPIDINTTKQMEEIERRVRNDNPALAFSEENIKKGTARFPEKELRHGTELSHERVAALEIIRRYINRVLPLPTRSEVRRYLSKRRSAGYIPNLDDFVNPYHYGIEERQEAMELKTIRGSYLTPYEQHQLLTRLIAALPDEKKKEAENNPEKFFERAILECSEERDSYGKPVPSKPYLAILKIPDGYIIASDRKPAKKKDANLETSVRLYHSLQELVRDGMNNKERKRFRSSLKNLKEAEPGIGITIEHLNLLERVSEDALEAMGENQFNNLMRSFRIRELR